VGAEMHRLVVGMTHFRKFRIAADGNSVQVVGCDCEICIPIAPPYSIPAAAHEPPPSSINNATRVLQAKLKLAEAYRDMLGVSREKVKKLFLSEGA
jgi:hypothetical protein